MFRLSGDDPRGLRAVIAEISEIVMIAVIEIALDSVPARSGSAPFFFSRRASTPPSYALLLSLCTRRLSQRMHRSLARSSRALRSSASAPSPRFALNAASAAAASASRRPANATLHARGLATATDKVEAQVQT